MFIKIKLAILNLLPLLITSLGAAFSANVGIINLGLEGSIIIGAFSSAIFAYYFSNAWIGLILGIIISLIVAILQSIAIIKIKAEGVMAGTAYNLIMSAASMFILKAIFKMSGNSPAAPILPTLFGFPILSYFIILMVFVSYYLINNIFSNFLIKNKSLLSIKYLSFILSNLLAALAGIYLSLGRVGHFNSNISGGIGFIALAVTSVANNNAIKILGVIVLFGIVDITQYFIELYHLNIPSAIIFSLPYILTLLLLISQNALRKKIG